VRACGVIGICLRTLKRWRKALMGDGDGKDRRKGRARLVAHRLSEEERQRILLTCNQPEYAALPPGQIVPALSDQNLFIGSESSFYRVLHQAGQCHRRGRARLHELRSVPRLRADGPNQVWSWDITFLPTTVRGVWLYLYLVVDVWSRLPGLGQRAGGTRWWPGMWPRWSRLRSQRIWCIVPASRSATTAPAALAAASASSSP